jgi:capsular exopolysaccharide synthesis family protein
VLGNAPGGSRREHETSLGTEIAVVLSKPVLNSALQKVSQFDRDLVEKFSGNNDGKTNATDLVGTGAVTATMTGEANVITIATSAFHPVTAARLSQAVADAYLEYSKTQKQDQAGGGAEYIKTQVTQVRAELDKARRAVKEFKEKHNVVDPDADAKARIDQLGSILTGLRAAQADKSGSAAQLGSLQSIAKTLPENIVGQTTTTPSTGSEALKTKLTTLEVSRIDALQEYTASSPEVKSLSSQIADLKKRLQGEAQRQVGVQSVSQNPVRTQVLQNITQTQAQVWALEARIRALETAESRARGELEQLPAISYRLSQLMTDVGIQQAAYQTLSDSYQKLLIQKSSTLSGANVLSPPDVPEKAAYPRKIKNMLAITVLALLLALGWAAIAERLDNKVHSEDEAEAIVRRPVLAQVPAVKELAQQSLLNNLGKPTPLLESFRMLRTNLTFSALDKPIRSVAITSSLPGEGKSTSAMNLAIVSAMSGKQVILVDGDLRRPTVHRLLGVANRVGFTNLVSGSAQVDEALSETKIPGLRVVTSGPLPPDPPELLSSKAARAVLGQIAELADLVIIDCPPALAMADAQIIASMSDAVLLVVSSKDAGKAEIARTSELLFHTGARFLGVILNKITSDFTGYQRYEHYGNYLDAGRGDAASEDSVAEDASTQLTEGKSR